MSDLRNEAAAARELLASLSEDMPDADDEAREIAVESETDLVEAVAAAYAIIEEAETFIAALKIRAGDIDTRIAVLTHRIGRIRDEIATAIDIAGVPHVRLPEGTVYPIHGMRRVEVVNESEIPNEFWETKEVKTLKRTELARALRKGDVPGAVLGNGRRSIAMRKN